MSSMQVAMLAGDEILKIEIPELMDPPVAKLCQHSRDVKTRAPYPVVVFSSAISILKHYCHSSVLL